MKSAQPASGIAQLLQLIDEAFDHRSWHGTNLRGSIRGLTARQAAWRARPGGHRIAEIVVHAAYWKYAVRRRLRGEPRGTFARKGSNWFALPEPLDDADWRSCVELLGTEHRALRAAIADLTPARLAAQAGQKVSPLMLVHGIAMHDVYHAGQIQVIKGVGRKRCQVPF